MTFASGLGLVLLALFGAAIIAGALNARRLIAWENYALGSLADNLRELRVSLEEERDIVGASYTKPAQRAVRLRPAAGRQQGGRAA